MLNPFPDLLTYSFFAPTILRLGAAMLMGYGAFWVWTNRRHIAQVRLPIVGYASWIGATTAIIHGVIAVMLAMGFYTQIAAILGILGALKAVYFARRYREIIPFSRSTYWLLIAILLSLLLTGAGALAKDLPL